METISFIKVNHWCVLFPRVSSSFYWLSVHYTAGPKLGCKSQKGWSWFHHRLALKNNINNQNSPFMKFLSSLLQNDENIKGLYNINQQILFFKWINVEFMLLLYLQNRYCFMSIIGRINLTSLLDTLSGRLLLRFLSWILRCGRNPRRPGC
jgi:hypothetical protein